MYFIFICCFKQKWIYWAIFEKVFKWFTSRMVFDKLGPPFIKKLLKSLAIFLRFLISLTFTLTMFGWILLLNFSVISCRIPSHNKFIHMIEIGYTNIQSKTKINGPLSDQLTVIWGVRQGCPLSYCYEWGTFHFHWCWYKD